MTDLSVPTVFEDQVAKMIQEGAFFRCAEPAWVARAPGRLDLMGGNVDYTGGTVLQLPLREAVWAAVQPTPEPRIRILNPGVAQFGWESTLEIQLSDLSNLAALQSFCERSAGARWGKYVLGALHLLCKRYGSFSREGANVFLASDLPPNRGVGSSAAIEIATLKAASAAQGITLDGVALAAAGQWVENVVAHSACGIMDQAAVVLGEQNCLLPIMCQPCSPLRPIALPEGLCIWGVDSMVPRSTTRIAYETARAAAFIGYKLICQWEGLKLSPEHVLGIPRWTDTRWNGYLSNIRPSEFRSKYETRLPASLKGRDFLTGSREHVDPFTSIDPSRDYPVRAAVCYAIEEAFRIEMVKTLLASIGPNCNENTLRLIGEVQAQSHLAYAGCGLGSTACDELVTLAHRFGFLGAKMTGGGAGGVVAILGFPHQADLLHRMVEAYAGGQHTVPHIFQGSSDGADIYGAHAVALSVLQGTR